MQWNGKGYDENGNVIYELINGTGKVKEYEEKFLVFEGEYLNGKRNGKGKEYNKDENGVKLKFDGEYMNGKKWSGIEYDKQGRTINVLENGNGYIKEFDDEGNLIFKGEYKNGEKNGKGYEYSIFGTVKFDGEYKNGKRNGKGIIFNNDNKIKGEFINGQLNGKADEYNNNILIFKGEFKNGKRNGKGKLYDSKKRLISAGKYFNSKFWDGFGYDTHDNIVYEIKNGNGYIKEYSMKGKLKFEVEYRNGNQNGKGKEYNSQGELLFEGEYKNGKRNGKGKEYNSQGDLIYEGEYKNGESII